MYYWNPFGLITFFLEKVALKSWNNGKHAKLRILICKDSSTNWLWSQCLIPHNLRTSWYFSLKRSNYTKPYCLTNSKLICNPIIYQELHSIMEKIRMINQVDNPGLHLLWVSKVQTNKFIHIFFLQNGFCISNE